MTSSVRPRPAAAVALSALLALLLAPSTGRSQDADDPEPDETPAWAVSLELTGAFDEVYGGWRRLTPSLEVGVEARTVLQERNVEVDRLDRPAAVDNYSEHDAFTLTVGPSLRWRVLPEAALSPVLRLHGGYARETRTLEEADGDVFDRVADGVQARASAGLLYGVTSSLDVILGLGGSWSSVEGVAQFHVKERNKTTELRLLVPSMAVVLRF